MSAVSVDRLIFKLTGNPLKIPIRDLMGEEIRLRNGVDRIRKETDTIEKDSKKIFRDGISADPLKKKMLVQDMKALDTELKLKLKTFITARGQLAFIKNLLILKKFEKELKKMGIWKKLTTVSKEKLEAWLIKLNLDQKEFDQIVEDLNKSFDMEVVSLEPSESDEREKSIFEAWDRVEAGSIKAEEAESSISAKKELEKAEQEA